MGNIIVINLQTKQEKVFTHEDFRSMGIQSGNNYFIPFSDVFTSKWSNRQLGIYHSRDVEGTEINLQGHYFGVGDSDGDHIAFTPTLGEASIIFANCRPFGTLKVVHEPGYLMTIEGQFKKAPESLNSGQPEKSKHGFFDIFRRK